MLTKQEIYDTICRTLTNYEDDKYPNDMFALDDMYNLLVVIQNNWEEVITIQE